MKRFMVFSGHNYPQGGAEDFDGSFDTIVEARAFCRGMLKGGHDWAHIFDLEDGLIVRGELRSTSDDGQ